MKNIYIKGLMSILLLFIGVSFTFENDVFVSTIQIDSEEHEEKVGEKPGIHQLMMRTYGSSNFTQNMAIQAKRQYRSSLSLSRSMLANDAPAVNLPSWTPRGPTKFNGRVTSVVADSQNPDKVYVGTANGGVWKSTDGGMHYAPIFDNAGSLSIGALAIDPNDSDILYVGTGESNPGGGSVTANGDGVWKSSDGGQTWQHLGLVNSERIGRIVINPSNTDEIFVAAVGSLYRSHTNDRGLYRSQDGGETWIKVLEGRNGFTGAIDVKVDPENTNTFYAVMWEHYRTQSDRKYGGPGSGIFKSTDGGDTWTKLTGTLPHADTGYGRIGLAIASSSPERLYAIYSDNIGHIIGFYRSDDYGESWTKVNDGTELGGSSYYWWFGEITVSPNDKNTVYVQTVYLCKSTNGGNDFTTITGLHADKHTMWFSPNGNIVYQGNDGGIYRSDNGGNTFVHQVLPITQFYAIEIDPNNHNKLFGGAQDNGSGYTTDGENWTHVNGGDGFTVLSDDNLTQSYVYYESQYGSVSVRGFENNIIKSFSLPSTDRKAWHTQMVFDQSDNRIVYVGSQYLYRTIRTGEGVSSPIRVSSIDFSKGIPNGSYTNYGTISSIDVPVSGEGRTIYLGTNDANVWVSKDTGATWRKINAGLPNRWVTRITADPHNDAIAYVTFSGYKYGDNAAHIFRTTDYGETWINISNNLPNAPISDVLVDPDYSSTLYCANDFGVYISYDTGTTWIPFSENLPTTLVSDLKIVQEGSDIVLVAGTYGRGSYSVRLNSLERGLMATSPTPPSNLHTTNITSNAATLRWTDNANNETGFKVYGNNTLVATLGANIHSYALTGLSAETAYTYSIKAYNSAGTSNPSTVTFTTLPAVPAIPTIAFNSTVNNTWDANTVSTHRSGRYAKFYTFTLTQSTAVTIDLMSSTDTYLFLLQGNTKNGSIIENNDDGGSGYNSRITRTLSAGTYTIEATTYSSASTGAFTVRVSR